MKHVGCGAVVEQDLPRIKPHKKIPEAFGSGIFFGETAEFQAMSAPVYG